MIDRAMAASGYVDSVETVRERCLSANAQLWVATTDCPEHHILAACVTRIIETGSGKVLDFWALGGAGMDEWLEHLPRIERWAIASGARRVRFECREGFRRALKPSGYELSHIVMQKDLSNAIVQA